MEEAAVPRQFSSQIKTINQGQETEEFIRQFKCWNRNLFTSNK